MFKRILPAALLPLFLLLIATSAANANRSLDFCSGSSCKRLTIVNKSAVVATRVTIHQKGKDGCASDTKAMRKDMSYGQFSLLFTPTCTYTIRFKTTKSCVGKKKLTLKPSTTDRRRVYVTFLRGCGSLTVKAVWSKESSGK